MSSGLSPALPLKVSDTFGAYDMITSFESLANQNLKMLLLTSPGERVMDTTFGVGLRHMLFESNTTDTYALVDGRIREQVQRYLPFIKIEKIDFLIPEGAPDLYPHTINLKMYYQIMPLSSFAMLEVDVAGANV
jgi:phage baseplate assembly protein W|tara:strand:+ start:31049 stop:31450 length:402 start_codon:yes stop_codon:yes gene_type:complete